MNRFLALTILASMGCASPEPASGPDPVPPETPRTPAPAAVQEEAVLTLDEALALADQSHPELAEAQARVQAARGRARQAGEWPNPALIVRVEAAGTDEEERLAGFSQSLPIGGRLDAGERAEALDAERLMLELESRRHAVRARVRSAFAAALFAQQAQSVQKEAAADAALAVSVSRSLAGAGEALAIDVSRAQMELARIRIESDRAASLSKDARVALAASIGRPGLAIQSASGSLEGAIELPALESLAASLEDHPALKAARAGVLSREARFELAEAQRIPDVNLELLYRRVEPSEEDSFDIGVSVHLPIFNRNRGAIREARAERRAAEAQAGMTAVELSRDLRQAHLRLSRSLAAARAIKEEWLSRQEEIARVFEARYAAGDAALADVLPVRRERIAVRLTYLESLRDVMEAWGVLSPFLKAP